MAAVATTKHLKGNIYHASYMLYDFARSNFAILFKKLSTSEGIITAISEVLTDGACPLESSCCSLSLT